MVKVCGDKKAALSAEVLPDVEKTRPKARRVLTRAILKSVDRGAEEVAVLVWVGRVGGRDAMKEVVLANLFEQSVDDDVQLCTRDKGNCGAVRAQLCDFRFCRSSGALEL